ncbi:hypothetical protein J6590_069150 [Homalodisca vitripennis]|nr:hypothetical protein J6590_069150 [Homalodisca vitripennis]
MSLRDEVQSGAVNGVRPLKGRQGCLLPLTFVEESYETAYAMSLRDEETRVSSTPHLGRRENETAYAMSLRDEVQNGTVNGVRPLKERQGCLLPLTLLEEKMKPLMICHYEMRSRAVLLTEYDL